MNARFLFKSAFLKLAFPLVILALAALAAPERGSAQVLYGSIVGNVKDSTGATVPDAVVSIVQVETKRARQTTTSEAGGYTFATIPSGTYMLKVSKEGFSPFTENQVPVTINSVTRVDVTLKIGSVSQAVEVTAETALLQTDRSEVRAELTGMELRELPVPVRNYQSMFRMIPGFSVPTNEHSVPSNPSRALRYNVNGTSASSNNVRIDGASSYNIWLPHITAYVPPMEAIETVNVVTNSFDAEQGLAGGSAVNVQIKSGTKPYLRSIHREPRRQWQDRIHEQGDSLDQYRSDCTKNTQFHPAPEPSRLRLCERLLRHRVLSLRPPRRRYQNQLEYNLEAEHLWAVQHDAFRLALAAGLRRHGPDFGQWGEPRHGLGEHLQLHDRGSLFAGAAHDSIRAFPLDAHGHQLR